MAVHGCGLLALGGDSPKSVSPAPSLGGRGVEVLSPLDPPKDVQIHKPAWVRVAHVVLYILGVIGTIICSPFLLYSWYKIRPLKKAIKQQFAAALKTACELDIQGLQGEKRIAAWINDRAFCMDVQRAYFAVKKQETPKPSQSQLRQWQREVEALLAK